MILPVKKLRQDMDFWLAVRNFADKQIQRYSQAKPPSTGETDYEQGVDDGRRYQYAEMRNDILPAMLATASASNIWNNSLHRIHAIARVIPTKERLKSELRILAPDLAKEAREFVDALIAVKVYYRAMPIVLQEIEHDIQMVKELTSLYQDAITQIQEDKADVDAIINIHAEGDYKEEGILFDALENFKRMGRPEGKEAYRHTLDEISYRHYEDCQDWKISAIRTEDELEQLCKDKSIIPEKRFLYGGALDKLQNITPRHGDTRDRTLPEKAKYLRDIHSDLNDDN